MNERACARQRERTNERPKGRTDGRTDGRTNERTNERTKNRANERTNKQTREGRASNNNPIQSLLPPVGHGAASATTMPCIYFCYAVLFQIFTKLFYTQINLSVYVVVRATKINSVSPMTFYRSQTHFRGVKPCFALFQITVWRHSAGLNILLRRVVLRPLFSSSDR